MTEVDRFKAAMLCGIAAAVFCVGAAGISPMARLSVVQDVDGYNSWPMIQVTGGRLVCAYGRGKGHSVEGSRGAYVRTSTDCGRTWTPEVCIVNDPVICEGVEGAGRDSTGAALFWMNCRGHGHIRHELHRTVDGIAFEKISAPELSPEPIQITGIFSVRGALMSLWFAGNYRSGAGNSWGTLVSRDDGKTWEQRTVESGLAKQDWPTEICAVPLGDGRLLAIGRSEGAVRRQFQLTSLDGGVTWKKSRTNIRDVLESTPSLIYDGEAGVVSHYYYQRGQGILWRRTAKVQDVFDRPECWPAPVQVARGGRKRPYDSGNVTSVAMGDSHYLAYYSGDPTDTAVLVARVAARQCDRPHWQDEPVTALILPSGKLVSRGMIDGACGTTAHPDSPVTDDAGEAVAAFEGGTRRIRSNHPDKLWNAIVALASGGSDSAAADAARTEVKLPERMLSGYYGWFLNTSQDKVRYLIDRCAEAKFNSIEVKIQDKRRTFNLEPHLQETRSLMEYANSKGLIFQLYLYPVPYNAKRVAAWKEHADLPCVVDEEGNRLEGTFLLTDSAVWRQLFAHAFQFLRHHGELPFATLKFDVETIPAVLSYDDVNWTGFCDVYKEFSPSIPASKRRSALDGKGRFKEYRQFFVGRTELAVREFVAALRAVDKNVVLGYMPAFKGPFYGSILNRVLASDGIPAVIDNWDMYNGEGFSDTVLDHVGKSVAANPQNLSVPWIRPNCYRPSDIAPAVYQAAAHSAGYSLWSLGMLLPGNESAKPSYRLPQGTTAADYWTAFRKANEAMCADIAAGTPGAGKRIPREKTKALAAPLAWSDVTVPDLVPEGDGSGADHEFVLRERQVVFIYAKDGENIEVSIRHVAGRKRPVALHYALLDSELHLMRVESVTPCDTDTFKVVAPKTGPYALVVTGGEGGLAWYGVTVRNGLHYALDARNGCNFMREQYAYMPGRDAGNGRIALATGPRQAILLTVGDGEPILMAKEKTKLELDLAGGITRFNFASHPKIAYFDEVSVRFPGGMTPLVFGEAGRRLAFRKK